MFQSSPLACFCKASDGRWSAWFPWRRKRAFQSNAPARWGFEAQAASSTDVSRQISQRESLGPSGCRWIPLDGHRFPVPRLAVEGGVGSVAPGTPRWPCVGLHRRRAAVTAEGSPGELFHPSSLGAGCHGVTELLSPWGKFGSSSALGSPQQWLRLPGMSGSSAVGHILKLGELGPRMTG